jgi:endonuclease G, mitochondrial
MQKSTLLFVLLFSSSLSFAEEPLLLEYEGFSVWLDCEKRAPVKFEYIARRDGGNVKRKSRFYIDNTVPTECQQTSVKSYRKKGERYDRGHMVPANHFDHSPSAIKETNFITNILPQAANMNRGAWLRTEMITECQREIEDLTVIGGVVWGNNKKDDFFFETHGIETPSAFWKVIITEDRAIAWLVPNSKSASWKRLDNYLVDIDTIEILTGETFPIDDSLRFTRQNESWALPEGCDKS